MFCPFPTIYQRTFSWKSLKPAPSTFWETFLSLQIDPAIYQRFSIRQHCCIKLLASIFYSSCYSDLQVPFQGIASGTLRKPLTSTYPLKTCSVFFHIFSCSLNTYRGKPLRKSAASSEYLIPLPEAPENHWGRTKPNMTNVGICSGYSHSPENCRGQRRRPLLPSRGNELETLREFAEEILGNTIRGPMSPQKSLQAVKNEFLASRTRAYMKIRACCWLWESPNCSAKKIPRPFPFEKTVSAFRMRCESHLLQTTWKHDEKIRATRCRNHGNTLCGSPERRCGNLLTLRNPWSTVWVHLRSFASTPKTVCGCPPNMSWILSKDVSGASQACCSTLQTRCRYL